MSARDWPLWAAFVLGLIWLPSLTRGFCGDDFLLVPVTLSQFFENPLWGAGTAPPAGDGFAVYRGEGRPISTLTFALLPNHAYAQHAVSLLIYFVCLWLMWRLCRRLDLGQGPTFLALTSFFHPAFLWNVTWIAHRYDLLVIAFLLLAILERRVPIKAALIALGAGAKPPLFFQNVVFAWQFARRRRLLAAAATLLWMIVFGIGIYMTRYAEESTVADSLYGLPSVVAIPLRIVKLAEGVLYVFAPVPMFAVTPWAPVVALMAYAACWVVLLRSLITAGRTALGSNLWIPALAVAMSVPFLFASDVRLTGAAAVMTYLSVAAGMQGDRLRMAAITAILVLNVAGIALNYGAFRSTQYDIRAAMEGCDYYGEPAYRFIALREEMRKRVLTALGVRTQFRKFP